MRPMSRRKLLGKGAQAVLAGGVAFSGMPTLESRASAKSAPEAVDYYQKLGITPFINAAGTYTVLSASTMPDEVQAAIALAARQPVNLNELLEASGAYLAKKLRCEAALVTSGAAAALVVGTAACIWLSRRIRYLRTAGPDTKIATPSDAVPPTSGAPIGASGAGADMRYRGERHAQRRIGT